MRSTNLKATMKTALLAISILLLSGLAAHGQQVTLTAAPSTLTMPDGQSIPMWGYTCGPTSSTSATCAKLNPNAAGWSPVVITVKSGTDLQINLTNHLTFANGNSVPTSLVIVGQLGGGLGDPTQRKTTPSPTHSTQTVTWPIAGSNPPAPDDPTNTPPPQPDRVQSFATEVAAGATTSLTWIAPRPGTYLLESGTHPSIQGPMGLYGIVVVTTPAIAGASPMAPPTPGTAYPAVGTNPAVTYSAEVPLLFSEIDPVQNTEVNAAVNTAGFSETKVWSRLTGGCGDPNSSAYHTCYPPAVNYTPLYYLINGVAFDRTNPSASLFPTQPATGLVGNVSKILVRMVNAGLRMHVPSIVGAQTTQTVGNTASIKSGFSLIAEDGNPLPGTPRVQSEVFLAAGKTYDVMITTPLGQSAMLPPAPIAVFDRELSLSGNSSERDAGMLAYIGTNGASLPTSLTSASAKANPDIYNAVFAGQTLTVSDIAKGVLANDVNVYGVHVTVPPTQGTLTLSPNGTFSYAASSSWSGSDSFTYCGNGATSGPACTTVTLNSSTAASSDTVVCAGTTFESNLAVTAGHPAVLKISPPGILAGCTDSKGFPLSVVLSPSANAPTASSGLNLHVEQSGGFTASVTQAGVYTFTFHAQNSVGAQSGATTVSVNFALQPSNLKVKVMDGADKSTEISDYRWIIEEDRTFYVDPNCTSNVPASQRPSNCFGGSAGIVPNFGTNFHTSYMPVIATGCTGPLSCESGQTSGGKPVVCDVGNGICRDQDAGEQGETATDPGQVALCSASMPELTRCLDPNKRYYISVLPGDAPNPFIGGNGNAPTNCGKGPYNSDGSLNTDCGHGMGGAPISKGQTAVTVWTEPSPYPPATVTVFVFEDDYPLNGEHDAGGGVDVLSPDEPGLGGFQISLFDDAGGTGDATGQPLYDMFNMPLSNSLAGTIDPTTGKDACPISIQTTQNALGGDGLQKGIVGMIVTCPTYESDGKTLSPLAGQAIVKNLWQGRYGVVATPGADRIAKGEEWLQTNTLDGQKAHDSFLRIGEPAYFQEFGPAGYHVTIGFANPKIINDRLATMCKAQGSDCTHEVKGHVTTARMSRTPDERLYGSGTHDSYSFTQCYISLGDPDGADFAFTKCADDGSFDFKGIPPGNWKITTFDQWNDQVVDGITTPVGLCNDPSSNPIAGPCTAGAPSVLDLGEVAVHQWQSNIYTTTFFDQNGNGVRDENEEGLALVPTNIRFRDGSYSNFNSTDLDGYAGFNEVFPLFNWYVVETDNTRYKSTGTHVVYDSGGPADGTSPVVGGTATSCLGQPLSGGATKPCDNSTIAANLANTFEPNPLPQDLHIPGAVYCAHADCSSESMAAAMAVTTNPPVGPNSPVTNSTGRIDPPWVQSYGWQGYAGQNNFLEFGKKPFAQGENGGIHGHVVYASTRPFDDPQQLLQLSWEPLVPHVRINLYKEGVASDNITPTLTLVDYTETSSFDDWAQGFHVGPNGTMVPNMSCPGQGTDTTSVADPYFWFALKDQPQWLDLYNHNGQVTTPIPHDSQFKCYDGMHNWNQLQPAPYDGMYSFPSVTSMDPVTGKPTGTNCTGCTTNPDSSDPYRFGTPMLPDGKYVVEVVVPPGFELVKEEDKNILIGDNFIAPVTQQFAGLGNIFILPDQAEVTGGQYGNGNATNPLNATENLGRSVTMPSHEGDTGSIESTWPCVGELRTVPDYISLYPGSAEVAPFAGASRHLCDRKEVVLTDQSAALAKFYIFTPIHVASHFTGIVTDDFTAEFDPYSPQFGEKFAPAYLPVSFRDWNGNEVTRVYTDAWGTYNGLNYSSWEVNPPNPTGYGPTMMVGCMNDAGPLADGSIDPLFQEGYSQFCYELPFMPGQTGYFDTPVVPVSAFAGGYNNADCAYPDATPAIKEVDGDGVGPWVSAAGHTLTITALGDQQVDNYGYTGPSATQAPYNQQKVTRHYGFGTAQGTVTIGNITAPIISWGDSQIQVTVPNGVPACAVQQQAQYGGSEAQCGQLVITAANGKQSIDTVTVTIGGSHPKVITPGPGVLQAAIDAAKPGDLLILSPGTYSEMIIMWKPLRLQGVGAASSIIDANPHPAGKLDPWRRQISCLFGLAMNGQPYGSSNPFDSTGTFSCPGNMQYYSGGPDYPTMVVDRVPMEGILGWDTTVNGNLAEQLIEPSLVGAYEGAGITVLAKGVKIPPNSTDVFGSGAESAFPTGSTLLTAGDCATGTGGKNLYPTNFWCNPSSIDGLGIQNSSQGGGGILVHAWAHNIQIANNRVKNNQGTLSGGITIGQAEHTETPLGGSANAANNVPPGSCLASDVNNIGLPFCYDMNVNIHNNMVIHNSSLGDELFSSTPAGAGGVTICNGSDYYNFNYNWVCGNFSTGDGGGFAHVGYTYGGDIEHNAFLFNQSTNPTIVTNGAGLLIMGAPDPDPACGDINDADCVYDPGSVSPSDGSGPGLVINANLILGNSSDSGSGGGLRFQHVNGTDVINFPNGNARVAWPGNLPAFQQNSPWNGVQVTNNIIANNVAGWDGAGVSLQDSLNINLVNNTIVSNTSTASSGVLFQSLFAPLASTQGTNCTTNNGAQSCPQVAGVGSVTHSAVLAANMANLPGGINSVICPANHGSTGNTCRKYSAPELYNDVIWQNRAFYIGVGGSGSGFVNQQNVVSLINAFTTQPSKSQASLGACDDPNAHYWEVGVRGDLNPSDHSGGILTPTYSFLTDASDYPGLNNSAASPALGRLYCNGSRVPPEYGGAGWEVPPGTNESNALPAPPFTLMPAAVVDEGNNWINLRWGPLALTNPITNTVLGDFTLQGGSPAINYIPTTASTYAAAPTTDFYGTPRKTMADRRVDVGAVEFRTTAAAPVLTGISPASGARGTTITVTLTGSNLTGTNLITVSGTGVTVSGINVVSDTSVTATFAVASNAGATARNVTLSTTNGGTSNALAFTVVAPTLTSITPNEGLRGTTVPVTLTGTGLSGATVVVSSTGVTATVTSATDTTVNANFVISSTAGLTVRNVHVTNGGGVNTNNLAFTVGPSLTAITPSTGARGKSVNVTLSGTALTGTNGIVVSGTGVTVSNFTVVNDSTITATFTMAANAAATTRSVHVTTPGGASSGNVPFTVTTN